ncbi:beta-lactamase family protein [Enterobacter cancerogenus]|uniref:Beta-lactamase family protein n=1 Tax=Enterobacter cancerogenus TaxID=69218 RepID=A0A484XRX0_9ENTR|nr:beta-lactamase family protein [Enterobacter cancerogenus]
MKNKSLNFTLLAGLVFTSLLSPVAMAACEGTDLATCPAPFDAKLPDTHSMLTWSQSDRVVGFRNDYRNYAGDVFRHGNATPLLAAEKPLKDASYQVNGKTYNLQDYLKRQNVSGMLVLKDGKVAWKYLGEGNTDSTLWTSRSVGKSVVSALVGVAIKEGKIHSLDDLVTQYEPDLKGTAWDGVTLKTADHPYLRRGVERGLHQPEIGFRPAHRVRSQTWHL